MSGGARAGTQAKSPAPPRGRNNLRILVGQAFSLPIFWQSGTQAKPPAPPRACNKFRTILLVCLFLLSQTLGLMGQAPTTTTAATAYAGKAIRLMQERNYSDAVVEFEHALAAEPNDDNLRIQYATCLYAQERNDDARRQFEILRQRRGDWPGLEYYLGLLDYRAADFASAIRRLEPLKTSPAFPKAAFYLGMAYLSAGQKTRALENLERAAKDNQSDPQVHYRLGRVYSMDGRTDDAERQYKLYRDLDENQSLAEEYGNACKDALHTLSIDQARPVCRKITDSGIEQTSDSRRLILLGRLYTQAGAFADAVAPLERAVELDPQSFDAWNFLGVSLFSLHRYRDALVPLRKAVQLNPRFFDTLNLLAASLHILGDDRSALPFLERAHGLNPDDAPVTAALERMRAAVKAKQ